MRIWKWSLLVIFCLLIPVSALAQISVEKPNMKEEKNLSEQVKWIKKVKMSGKDGDYKVTGEALSSQNFFYYSVEDGHYVFVNEQKVKLQNKFPKWSQFTIQINIPKERLPNNGTLVLNVYKNNQSSFPIILDTF